MFIIDNTLGFLRFVTLLKGLFIMKSQRAIISKHLNNFRQIRSVISYKHHSYTGYPAEQLHETGKSLDTIHMEDYGLGIRPLI